VLDVVIRFKRLVENYFGRHIKMFHNDHGGEFIGPFTNYLALCGNHQRFYCPTTPEQNGVAE